MSVPQKKAGTSLSCPPSLLEPGIAPGNHRHSGKMCWMNGIRLGNWRWSMRALEEVESGRLEDHVTCLDR